METPHPTLEDDAIAYSYTGEQQYFRHPLYPQGIVYTKGVLYVAEHGGAWLIDKIATMQGRLGPGQRAADSGPVDLQLWTLWVTEAQTWALTCQDGDYCILWAEGGSDTDFPMDRIDFFVEQGCIMLTSDAKHRRGATIMFVYHRTDAATQILEGGFLDGTLHAMNVLLWPGVWVSTFPLDWNEGAKGAHVLRLDIPETLFTSHEFVNEDGSPCSYREALIPAALLNAYGRPTLLSEAEVDELEDNDPRFQP